MRSADKLFYRRKIASFVNKLSLIPVLGLASCTYLMTELGYTNWMRFLIWLGVGLVIYFLYSKSHSKLGIKQKEEAKNARL